MLYCHSGKQAQRPFRHWTKNGLDTKTHEWRVTYKLEWQLSRVAAAVCIKLYATSEYNHDDDG